MADLPPVLAKLKAVTELLTEDEIKNILKESSPDLDEEVDFESFLRVCMLFLVSFDITLCISFSVIGYIDKDT